jgi:hypothetical protein
LKFYNGIFLVERLNFQGAEISLDSDLLVLHELDTALGQITTAFVLKNHSLSARIGTVRDPNFKAPPYTQA